MSLRLWDITMPLPQHKWLGFKIQMPLMSLISYCGSTVFNFSKIATAARKHLYEWEILISIYAGRFQLSLQLVNLSTLIPKSSNKFIRRRIGSHRQWRPHFDGRRSEINLMKSWNVSIGESWETVRWRISRSRPRVLSPIEGEWIACESRQYIVHRKYVSIAHFLWRKCF